ncbi:2-amino-4-hydroxy-6-hydroxymethyldihydropteridine diphosphokinase [Sporosarcina gallistercoris]|uniref:2-amino-4-hydroxy-6-hydroxymethyldihydropteridine diphosphokinase n=1 Tax=Sporosarcina gallistercoris TaxID=2762245 RepID=A0ABR8PMT5_9BACL|nr:2-amino-4-hydroxy-6-hydroxymethyldihydropteridine diphosphokinase [Sporosarcina gallistercoris]MBD7909497.1 2-amino-4-hydroxy-6-hydroxymethyldihydropteridine diphosphokinase [Sporosarcina gallistercoris]
MNTAFISIGTNMGDREEFLKLAVTTLCATDGIASVETSSIYETAPVGVTDQPDFLNMVVRVETVLESLELLAECQRIEMELGRVRTIRWGPRTADLDILLYNSDRIESETLSVPHPRMRERAFVLIPLTELAPECIDPVKGRPFREEPAMHDDGVKLWKTAEEYAGSRQCN